VCCWAGRSWLFWCLRCRSKDRFDHRELHAKTNVTDQKTSKTVLQVYYGLDAYKKDRSAVVFGKT
jgi:hypothetical protein